jgi:hypothetical protein
MIAQAPQLSPNQKAAIDDIVGRDLENPPKNLTRRAALKPLTVGDHQVAVDQMRYQLYLLDRSQRRPSIEDYISDFLEKPGTESQA